jgi:CMP-N,N'-diacetyllegionaminic acid synthase
MYNNQKFLAIIPARGGSKGIPKKNIINVNDQPLITYTIETTKKSQHLDKVYVSSDSDEILQVAKDHGAATLKRPEHLAGDTIQNHEVLQHIIHELEAQGETYDYVLWLQPTSPLRTGADIDSAIEKLIAEKNTMLLSITEADFPPDFLITLEDDVINFQNTKLFEDVRRQNLPQYYMLNGAIFIFQKDFLLQATAYPFAEKKTSFYLMPKNRSIDIDDLDDLVIVESYLKKLPK